MAVPGGGGQGFYFHPPPPRPAHGAERSPVVVCGGRKPGPRRRVRFWSTWLTRGACKGVGVAAGVVFSENNVRSRQHGDECTKTKRNGKARPRGLVQM